MDGVRPLDRLLNGLLLDAHFSADRLRTPLGDGVMRGIGANIFADFAFA